MNALKPMDLDTVDRLYLELSQFTTATTGKELALHAGIRAAMEDVLALCWQIEQCGASEELTKASVMASQINVKLGKLLPKP